MLISDWSSDVCSSDLDTAVHLAEIPDAQPLVAGGVPQEARPSDMKEIVLQDEPPAPVEEIGVGEVAGQGGIVIPQGRAQENQPPPADGEEIGRASCRERG